jgi:DNA-binding XRE family transcriptional regulator
MSFEVYELQNFKIRKDIYNKIDTAKNIDMLMYRIAYNLSQKQAANRAGLPIYVWLALENRKAIPTTLEASKIATLLGKAVFKLFPITRQESIRILPIRNFSKLAFIRCSRGLSQAELAKSLEVPITMIISIEREWKKIEDIPSKLLPKIQKLADYLGEDIINILGNVAE